MDDLEIGAVVVLKSGGPNMTVASSKEKESGYHGSLYIVQCSWFTIQGDPHTKSFPVQTLKIVKV